MMNGRYYNFSQYVKDNYKGPVRKITVDAGFSCPNRDGLLSDAGCIFCDNEGFSPLTSLGRLPVEVQIKKGFDYVNAHFRQNKIMVYFQAYSNTYASVEVLKEKYDNIKKFDGIVAFAIGTRPDCIDNEKLELINSYTEDYDVWLEYGLQSMHDKTLDFINRGHSLNDFSNAIRLTKKYPKIKICVHVILGLPGESFEMLLETAKFLASQGIDGIKLHPLHVVKATDLELMYIENKIKLQSYDEYLRFVIGFLEHIPPDVVVQRITAECNPEILVAPEWLNQKAKILYDIDNLMCEMDSFQGKNCQIYS